MVPTLLIFNIYCWIQLRQHWKRQYFVRRRQRLVLISLNAIYFYSVSTNIYAIQFLLSQVEGINEDHLQFACLMIHLFLLSTTLGLGGTCYLLRWWLLYYDMQLSQLLKNKDWQMAIDPNIVSNNWYLNPKNQRRFGQDGKYLLRFGFTCDIIICGSVLILRMITYDSNDFNIHALPDMIFYIYCTIKVK